MAAVDKGKLNAWIVRRKAENHTGYADAPTPFLVTPDEAWQAVLQGNDEMETDWNVTVLCYGVCRPGEGLGWSPEQCLKNLWRFGGQPMGSTSPCPSLQEIAVPSEVVASHQHCQVTVM